MNEITLERDRHFISRVSRIHRFVGLLAVILVFGGCCNDCGPPIPPYDVMQTVAIADMNGDGRADIAFAGYRYDEVGLDDSWVAVLTQNAGAPGTFATTSNVALTGGIDDLRLALHDVDGVNGPDLILSRYVTHSVAILRQTGGALALPVNTDVGPDPVNLDGGDLNGDGAVDLALADGRRPYGGVKVLLQNAAAPGVFLPPTTIAFDRVVKAVAIADIDGDGRTDLAAAAYSNIQGSNGAGSLSILYADPNNAGAFLPRVDFPAGAEPSSLRLADIDRDGRVDAVVTNSRPYPGVGDAGVSVLLQDPNMPRALLAPTFYAAPAVVTAVAVADLNGDGWPDLALANGSSSESLTVLLQDPARPGNFRPPMKYAAGLLANDIAVGDLNGDALPDIALATYNGVAVFFNNPATHGTFQSPTVLGR